MNVGFDGSRAFVKNRTGTENYSYQLLLHLAKIDKQNKYIVYLRPGNEVHPHPDLLPSREKELIQKIPSPLAGEGQGEGNYGWPENFQFKVLNFPRFWTQVGLSLQTFLDPLDVLFTPAHTLPLIRKPGLKTVMTVHDLGAEYLPSMHQLKQRLYLGFITKFQLKSTTKLIAVSKATKNDLIDKAGIDSEKIEVIYEGYTKILNANDSLRDVLTKFNLKEKDYFLFVGTIQPRKNLWNLISDFDGSFGSFENAPKLVIAGSKGWGFKEAFDLTKLLGLEEQVIFLGRVADEDLPSLYKGSIALVFPSRFEGFGLPILEAFEYGTPVITSNVSSMPEVAGKAAILVDLSSPLNDAMGTFINDKWDKNEKDYMKSFSFSVNEKNRQKYIKLGKEQLKKFSWEKCAKETLALFENL